MKKLNEEEKRLFRIKRIVDNVRERHGIIKEFAERDKERKEYDKK
jgi:hypothetical protein